MKESGSNSPQEFVDANTRACDTVFDALVTFPQSSWSTALIAERALWRLKGDNNQPSLNELANIKPDGEDISERIEKVHTQFSVPRFIEPLQAEAFISIHAGGAVELVRKKTVETAAREAIGIPEDLQNPIMSRIYKITPEQGELLEQTLYTNPDLLEHVYEEVKITAADVKSRAKAQRELHRGRSSRF